MNNYRYVLNYESCYRGKDFSAENLDNQEPSETAPAPQPLSAIEAKLGNTEAAGEEREKQLQLWMKNIQTFIRNIDVGKL